MANQRSEIVRRLRELVSDTFVYGFATVAGRFLGFVLVPVYARFLLPEEYGVIGIANAVYAVVTLFTILGIDNAVFRFYFVTENPDDRRQTIYTWIVFHTATSIVTATTLWLLGPWLATRFLRGPADAFLIHCLSYTVLLESVGVIGTIVLRSQRRTWSILIIGIGKDILRGILTLVLVIFFKFRAEGVLIAMVLTAIPYGVVNVWILMPEIRSRFFSAGRLGELLRFGLPAAPASFAAWAAQSADRLILEEFGGLSQVGRFTFASAIAGVLGLAVASFRQAWVPFALSIRADTNSKDIYSVVLTGYLVLSSTAALTLSLFADTIVRILGGGRYSGLGPSIGLLAFGWVAYGAYHIAYRGVIESGHTIHIGWTTVVAALISIAFNFALIPRFGVVGCATAGLIAQTCAAVLLMRQSQRVYPVAYRWRDMTIVIASAITCALIGFAAARMAYGKSFVWLLLLVHIGLLVVTGVIPARMLALRMVPRGDSSS